MYKKNAGNQQAIQHKSLANAGMKSVRSPQERDSDTWQTVE